MNAYANLEEFADPPNYDIEEGARSAPRIAFYYDLAKMVGGPVFAGCRSPVPIKKCTRLAHDNCYLLW